jgi:SAM-dependent methyltransferase
MFMSSEVSSFSDRYTEYDYWGWLYNQTMGEQYCQSQLQPLEALFFPQLPKQAKVLDLCCGTGQLVQKLVEKGYYVVGLDSSEVMLDYARCNANQAKFLLGDARQFTMSTLLDGVFSTSASLNHMMSLDDLQQVMHSVFSALKPGGVFLFDLNHHEQMSKWWNGRTAEGKIEKNYAWSITPHYDSSARSGFFTVTLFQGRTSENSSFIDLLKQLFYRVLNSDLRRITRSRLKILANFQNWEKNWQKSEISYDVRGYIPDEVTDLLKQAGFTQIEVKTLDGRTPLDSDHSAYFICRKPV